MSPRVSAVDAAEAVKAERTATKRAANPAKAERKEIVSRFSFHPATEKTTPLYEDVRNRAKRLALFIHGLEGNSREKALALTALQEATMWANAHIAIHLSEEP